MPSQTSRHLRKFPGLVCVAAACFLAACEKEKPVASTGSPVVAQAGDEVITAADVEKEAERRLARGMPLPEKSRLVGEMLERLAAVARAKKAGLADDPETRRELENVLIARLRAAELEPKLAAVTVSDEELKAEFASAAAAREARPRVRLALLRIQGEPKMSEAKKTELRTRMDEALKKAAAAEGAVQGFGQVAAEYSDDQSSRYQGGDIGWFEEGNFSYRWPRLVLEAGYQLEKGKCSPVIEDNGSLYAVMKTDSRPAAKPAFDELKGRLKRELTAKKRKEIDEAFSAENRSRTGAVIREEGLTLITLPQAPSGQVPPPGKEKAPPALPGMNPPEH